MSTPTRIYVVKDTDLHSRTLVRASSQAQAVRHVTKSRFEVEVASQDTIVSLMEAGLKVETAAAEAKE